MHENELPLAVRLADVRELCASGSARVIRQAADLSLAEVAREVGVSVVTVSLWERGRQRPTGQRALRYLDLLQELCRPASQLRRRRYDLGGTQRATEDATASAA